MNPDELRRYEAREREKVIGSLPKGIRDGALVNISALYPDVALAPFHALARGGVPLGILAFLYPQVTVYVPPGSRAHLARRFGIEYDSLIDLCKRRIIIPVIGHPIDYANKPHLDTLLRLQPPSVWARGLALLDVLGREDLFEEAARKLPLDQMAAYPPLRVKWGRDFGNLKGRMLTQRVRNELATNYVDLVALGFGDIADKIARIEDPATVAVALLQANEVLTYPLLFGIGGTPNYPASFGREVLTAARKIAPRSKAFVVPEYLKILLDGVEIDVGQEPDADTVIEFHKEGQSRHIWTALQDFERSVPMSDDPDEFLQRADRLQTVVEDAVRDIRSMPYDQTREKTRRRVRGIFVAGGASMGVAGTAAGIVYGLPPAVATMLAIFGGAPWVFGHVPGINCLERWVLDRAMAKQYSGAVGHLWRVRAWSRERRRG